MTSNPSYQELVRAGRVGSHYRRDPIDLGFHGVLVDVQAGSAPTRTLGWEGPRLWECQHAHRKSDRAIACAQDEFVRRAAAGGVSAYLRRMIELPKLAKVVDGAG